MVISTLCPVVHILGSQNVYGRAEGIADHYWPWAVFFFVFFLFFYFFSLFSCLQCTTEPYCTTKWAFIVKARKARALRRCLSVLIACWC